jgi:hypothetical protein
MAGEHDFHSLEDFLTSSVLHADGQLDDGWGAPFPVKGREIRATVLFADITGFSERTRDLSPAETLIFVNNFFAWISAEAIRGTHGIVDKYIGDEVMIVYSTEFGSDDPFVEAVQSARWMAQNDALSFIPHIGIASGDVIVGCAGTSLKGPCGASVVFPADDWGERQLQDVIPPQRYQKPDGEIGEHPYDWELGDPREVKVKQTEMTVRELVRTGFWLPSPGGGPEDRAREGLEYLRRAGLYRPDLPF